MPTLPPSRTLAVVVLLVAASLAGGAFVGYRSGLTSPRPVTDTEMLRLTAVNANLTTANALLTAENEALRGAAPEIAGRVVRIGFIAPESTSFEVNKVFIEKILQPDLNAYASSLGHGTSFEFVVEDAMGQANTHLEIVQKFKTSNLSVFMGAGWSSHGCASLSYVMHNDMLMMSWNSTSPTLAISGDRFFRMCPADNALSPALADVLWSYGIKELIIIQRGDSWGDGIVNLFVPEWTRLGGVAGETIRYVAEATDFCDYLKQGRTQAEAAIARMDGDTSRVAVLLLAFDEAHQILRQASQCEVLYNLVWFGADGTAKSKAIMENSPLEANHLKLFSLLPQEPATSSYAELEVRYEEATGKPFDIYSAYLYDAAWVLAKSILDTGSDDATKVAAALPGVCERFYGVTSWCRLNEYGDRTPPPYDIWFYAPGTTSPSESLLAGTYTPETGETVWNRRSLDFTVPGP